ncbi:MAG: reverse transcriptase/maturase family protein, partial [Candidatus Paceibacterota bacterium]
MDLYQALLSKANYQKVFIRLNEKTKQSAHRGRTAPIIKEINLDWVLRSEVFVTKKIIRELASKHYAPGFATKNLIKVKDKTREIFALAWPDKIVEAVIAGVLNQAFEADYSDSLYSFRQGRSNLTALERLAKYIQFQQEACLPIYFFKTDITKYGESINTELLLEIIASHLPPQEQYLWNLLSSFLDAKYQKFDGKQPQIDAGLPAGFSLTPVCENIYLSGLDQVISQDSEFYLRFGDDILLADSNPDRLQINIAKIIPILKSLNLMIHPEKSALISFQVAPDPFKYKNSFDYLGYSINQHGQLFLSANKEKELKRYLYNKLQISFHTIRKLAGDPAEQVKILCQTISSHYQQELRHPYLSLILAHGNDLLKIRAFDES